MKETFLSRIADHIKQKYNTRTQGLCIVFPGRRAGLFLTKYLNEKYDTPIWMPYIYSIEDFIAELSDLEIRDNLSLLFELYDVYKSVEGEEAEPFDEFVKWGATLLQDYNELDQYLVEPNKFFQYVNENRAMEVWSPDNPELTPYQLQYLRFWKSMGKYYAVFTQRLLDSKQAYQGLAYRKVAEDLTEKKGEILPKQWEKVLFVGFNALSASEKKLMQVLLDDNKAEVFWDADEYYMDNELQEAGLFLREYRKKWKSPSFDWVSNNLTQGAKKIQIIGIAQDVTQAKMAGAILSKEIPLEEIQETAVVLADEGLLLPVLHSIPDSIANVNVTMGLPLKHIPLYNLFDTLLQLHENAKQWSQTHSQWRFYHKDIVRVLNHAAMKKIYGRESINQWIATNIVEKNKSFLSPEELKEGLKEISDSSQLTQLFTNWNDAPSQALESFKAIIQQLKETYSDPEHTDAIELEYLFAFSQVVSRMTDLMQEFNAILNLKTMKGVFRQVVKSQTLPFFGEPLKGLQVMGMLETRSLDFKHVILLSANENILPAGKTNNSFIPYDIRYTFGLPTHTNKDAIYAYHFYHLLQRAENVYLLYNTETEGWGKGEKSRYITQLLHELPHVNSSIDLVERIAVLPFDCTKTAATSIQKDDSITKALSQWASKGISPTALISFINCPLDFYYKYIIKLKEEEEVEETMEAGTLGSVVHAVLEQLYQPYINAYITADNIKQMQSLVEQTTLKAFKEIFASPEKLYGKNLLIQKVAIRWIDNYLKEEVKRLSKYQKEGTLLQIIALEKKLSTSLSFADLPNNIVLSGKADRIEKLGDAIQIIDYKTGKVKPSDLKLEEMSQLLMPEQYNKCFQLLLYAYLYHKSHPDHQADIRSGIVSFKSLSSGINFAQVEKNPNLTEEDFDAFEQILHKVLKDIYDTDQTFEHNPEASYCSFCR